MESVMEQSVMESEVEQSVMESVVVESVMEQSIAEPQQSLWTKVKYKVNIQHKYVLKTFVTFSALFLSVL